MKLTPQKTRGVRLPSGEDFMILTSTFFLIHPYDGQTERWTDRRTGDSIVAR